MPAAWVIAALTLVSRMLGLLRESVFGYYFSTSQLLSAFRIAFMIPNLARRLFGEGALSSALVPVLTQTLQEEGEENSRRFVGRLLIAQALLLLLLTVAVELVIAGWRTWIVDDAALALTAILLPYMGLICIVALGGAVLNVRRYFAVPAAAPVLLNLMIILAAVVGSAVFTIGAESLMVMICVAVLVAGALQLVATGWALKAVRFFPIIERRRRDPRVRRVILLMGPMVLGLSAVQINSLFDYLIAYWFVSADGERVGPAVLGYAQYLYQLPLGVFGVAIATALFPAMSEQAAVKEGAALTALFFRGLRLSLFIALPAGAGLMFVAEPLVATLYERGAFHADDTRRVASVLFFYSLGMPAYFVQHLVVRLYYTLNDSRTPAYAAIVAVLFNVLMNLGLVQIMEERGLALATSVCAYLQTGWLLWRVPRFSPAWTWRGQVGEPLKAALATVVMVGVLGITFGVPVSRHLMGMGRGVSLAVMVTAGVLSYWLAALALRMEEASSLLRGPRGRVL